ncbi:MAG: sensor domain-containing diguanylate cyclase [Deltaproteobacteria bacterium]|nr:sensor domain-containing diguanylate cyclase [Deltaproteobacteria bacterium]
MNAKALSERRLRAFLERERRRQSRIAVPPVGRLLSETLELGRQLVPCRVGSLLLDDPRAKRHGPGSPLTFVAAFGARADTILGTSVPAGKGIVGAVYRSGDVLSVSDPGADPRFFSGVDEAAAGPRFQTKSLLAVPVRLENRVCGVLELLDRRGRSGFSDSDRAATEIVAGHLSRIVLNAVDVLKQNTLARTDDLTGLRNARGLDAEIQERAKRARRRDRHVAVLFLDVDGLKKVNDAHGHRAGSEAIRRIGRSLAETVGSGVSAHRFGGDEFVVITPGDAAEGEALAERLRQAAADRTKGPMRHGGRLPAMTVSVGVAATDRLVDEERDAGVGARLLAAADRALYRAKGGGRDRVVVATRRDDRLGKS